MDEKMEYVREQFLILRQHWISKILLLGAILFLLLGSLDYLFTPNHFTQFLVYRVSAAVALLLLFIVNQHHRNSTAQHIVIFIGTAVSAVTIEAMIMALGGHRSPYYAGMSLLTICVLGYSPFSFRAAMLGVSLICLIYLVPILAFDRITDMPTFLLNNAFLLATVVIALSLRTHSQRATARAIELQYDLEEEKKKIERQAELLEEMVNTRTEQLRLSNKRFQELFDYANDGIVVLDRSGLILNANNNFCSMYGYEKKEVLGNRIDLIEGENANRGLPERMRSLIEGRPLVFEAEHCREDGKKVLVEVSAKAIDIEGEVVIQAFHRDVTEKKKLQEQLLQSQKMESLGILVGGLAHDFNNILSQIVGYAGLISGEEDLEPSIHSKALIIEKAGVKASVIVTKLLSFARASKGEMKPINLNHAIKDTLELLERMLAKKGIRVSLDAAEDLPCINGDINQVEQVLVNLLVNASDAMPDGGAIAISTSVDEIAADGPNPILQEPGLYAVIRVRDTGTGIPAEIRDKIFDPFFTTKDSGKGTGLGLAMSYGIAKAHGGAIHLNSEVGKGTTFSVYFPVSDMAGGLHDDVLNFLRRLPE